MKPALFLLWLLAAAPLLAQDASRDPLASLDSPILITSRSADILMRSNIAIYVGDVRVSGTNLNLTCEWLEALRSGKAGRIDRITARTNVLFDAADADGEKIHVEGAQAIYSYTIADAQTNELVVVTGNPMLTRKGITSYGDRIVFDRSRSSIKVDNPRMTLQTDAIPTNSAAPPTTPPANNAPPTPP